MKTQWLMIVLVMLMAGCESYEKQPLDMAGYGERWEKRLVVSKEIEKMQKQLQGGEREVLKEGDGITFEDAKAIALVYHPGVRLARMKANVPLVGSKEVGRWLDPHLSFDLMRNTDKGKSPWISGVGLGFTIPLSGGLGVAKKQVAAEYAEARLEAIVAENELVVELSKAWVKMTSAIFRYHLYEKHLKQLEPLHEIVRKLQAAGELDAIEARVLAIEITGIRGKLIRSESEAHQLRLKVMSLIGLHPDHEVAFEPVMKMKGGVVIEQGVDFMNHPRMLVVKAGYERAELAYEREVRKQYPDLEIGPGYENEDGQSRVGLSGGLPLPVLNGNKQAIVEAKQAREVARIASEQVYEALVHRARRLVKDYQLVSRELRYLEDEVEPNVKAQMGYVMKMMQNGELSVLMLKNALDASLEMELLKLEVKEKLADIENEYMNLVNPIQVTPDQLKTKEGDESHE